ncbi:MAG TPA: glycine betaine ABC transporter substrate-binding protein [Chloroflexota bacterium]|jgi:glycine betaine/choline ABC-type transport system substrate-binding protein|nr:glycine betaine ABC transporter substrate-binding protein [Chloroflexota bacterium]
MNAVKKSRRLALTLGSLLAVLALAIAQIIPAQAGGSVQVGARGFTEEEIAGYLYGDILKDHGLAVTVNEGFGSEDSIFTALKTGAVNLAPDYLGNGLVDLNKIYKPGRSVSQVQATVNKAFAKYHLELLTPSAKFNDTNLFVTTKAISKKYGLHTLSDLARLAPKLSIEVLQECTTRTDCLLGFDQVYHPKKFKTAADPAGPTNPGNQPFYDDLLSGKFTVVQGYGYTDPQISKYHLVPLKDNKGMFPPDNMTPFISTALAKNKNLVKWLNKLSTALTNSNFRAMDASPNPPQQVADAFLKAHHLN